ncbi:MAG: aminotransferase class III-fold pyridoxal phosphate-dependent enzyme [Stagnimonas sp.]|nr:aminotransferase class III-fold pyridoxal phosphate-dependent enzyme [Stagnimonas sp.]
MAARLPGADSVEQFWSNLRDGVESIVPISEAELDAAGVAPEQRADPHYVRRHATLADADCFDHAFFGVSPREAALMDPQQRLLLECAWAALEHAGYDPAHTPGRVGAYCGVARNSYFSHNLAGDPGSRAQLGEVHITFGNDKDYAATHISHKLNLRGPALSAQTACSTGGVLMHLARRALLAGDCDAALVGGARVVSPLKAGYPWIDGSIFSKDGRMRVFDAEGSGMIRGSGVACLLLKRRADAERDGDTIYAVLRGSALNNDGSDKVSYTAPSVGGQAEVIGLALDDAGVSADTISYVEAHGTATYLGDPIEVAALTQAYRQHSGRQGYCKLGSVKSNIGHLDPASALASTIKTALALKHRYIPASLGYQRPNPQIDFASSPFTVAAQGADWDGPGPRRAGVSSFGIGGTNAHLILEEAVAPARAASADPRRWQLLPLAAKTDSSLEALGAKLAQHFGGPEPAPLADAAWTLQTGRGRFDRRAVMVAADAGGASRALQAVESWARGSPLAGASLVFVFPGQGAQHPGMGRELYQSEPLYRALIDEGCALLQPELGVDLRSLLYPPPTQAAAAADTLRQTSLAQPAIFLASYALAKLWQSLGLWPALMLGHSVGEFVAGTLAGVFSYADALKLLAARARLMQAMPEGSMLALRLPEDRARALLPAEVDIAAVNSPSSTIVSGPTPAIEALEATLKARDIGTARLHTSHAFHSSMMDAVLEPFAAEVAAVPRGVPQRPIISTATGLPLTAEQARDPRYWARQLRGTVRFADAVAEALKQPGRVLLEVGPGQSLSGPLRQLVGAFGGGKATVVSSAPAAAQEGAAADEQLMQALGRLWIAGIEPDWIALHGGARQHVGLPTYAFARHRHWIEPSLSALPAAVQAAALAPAASSAQDSAAAPADALRGRAVKLLTGITGLEFGPGDDNKSFLELGMDSLMLTQVAGRLKAEFRLELKFRQLMEELSTLDRLCAYLKTHASGLPLAPAPDGNQAPEPVAAPVDGGPDAAPPAKAFGAAVRITRAAGETLTPRQRKSLDALIARYNARTAKSKASAQQHRVYFADPRTVSGFRPLWKETVYPIVSTRSEGAKLWDLDGNEYIDTVNGFGATLFGHKPAFVDQALREQIERGYEVGPVQEFIGEAARLFTKLSHNQRVAFCNTGSEAVAAAVRCARTVTGRDLVVSFNGDYHGIQDEAIVRPGPKGRGVPAAGGIPFTNTASTLILDYGDPKSLEIIAARADEIAAVMVEPVQSRNMDLQPREFLHECRRLADASGYAFIMDEVISGFRAAPGGAQEYFGVQADLASYGKVFGGGLPVGAVAGKARFMDALDGGGWQFGDGSVPEAGVTYFAGTFVRHPLVMAAVLAVLRHLDANPGLQATLAQRTSAFVERLEALCRDTGAPLRFPHFSSTFRLEWTQDEPFQELFAVYLRERGLHTYDGRVQVMTTAHTEPVLEQLLGIFRDAILAMQRDGLLGRRGEPVKIGFDAEAAGGIFYQPPLPGARLGRDAQGNPAWFVPDPERASKYLQIGARP